jgi:AraC-like DNA-binding protein
VRPKAACFGIGGGRLQIQCLRGPSHRTANVVDQSIDQIPVLGLAHDADERLGARSTNEETAAAAEASGGSTDHPCNGRVLKRPAAIEPHIAQHLRQRFEAVGATYAEIVDDLRRSLALQYLKDQSLSLSQIAWLLGYDEATSFTHAFKRWTGRSPSAARQERRLRPKRSKVV